MDNRYCLRLMESMKKSIFIKLGSSYRSVMYHLSKNNACYKNTAPIILLPKDGALQPPSIDRKEALTLGCILTPQASPPTPAALAQPGCRLSGVCLLPLLLWVGQHGAAAWEAGAQGNGGRMGLSAPGKWRWSPFTLGQRTLTWGQQVEDLAPPSPCCVTLGQGLSRTPFPPGC